MPDPSSDGRRWMPCCYGLCPCCRRAGYENGVGRFTLRFEDPMQEAGFVKCQKARLSHHVVLLMALSTFLGLITIVGHRYWDEDQYATNEARELSRWQLLMYFATIVSFNLGFSSGTLLAKYNVIGTLGLEIAVVIACGIVVMAIPMCTKHYLARAFGYDDTEAIWGVDTSPTDGNVVLYIDCVVTAVHLLVPIRWVVLAPFEVIPFLAYAVPALTLGSPAVQVVHFNMVVLLALTVFAAVGKRAFERQEREMFAGFLAEKQMRFQAEFQLSRVGRGEDAAGREDVGSDRSLASSRPETTRSASAFDGGPDRQKMIQMRAIGLREQWLIASGEVELMSCRALGEGGFGIVVPGLYHNTLVAVKAPKEGIARKGLSALCNELRILRRLRHPNIAFFYGACMDAGLNKICLVLEYVDGVSLGAFIRSPSRGPDQPEGSRCAAPGARAPERSVSVRSLIVFDILNVLRYLHSREPAVVHGDLKDSNVFVEERFSRSGRPSFHAKLLDFGLSRNITRSAKPLGGTLRWMAPELVSRQAVPPDVAADCYSFGLLTYFIVTGSLPFEGTNAEVMLKRLRRGQSPSLSWPEPADELTQVCQPVVEQCIKPMPALRPTDQQVSNELTPMLNKVAGGVMETAVETLTPAEAISRGTKSPGDTEKCDVDDPACKELMEFSGVVKVRQASSSCPA
ncbi:unnamed protein product [Prorocentrum cordatum]|uniref:Protein kinase domain-containing protein n=1 Tax=Prorocentrum cordatum TaxID=2364126 RepID=A0ABN9U2F2_9DINO|nr:unnamed protein product [Polarella glacialis]